MEKTRELLPFFFFCDKFSLHHGSIDFSTFFFFLHCILHCLTWIWGNNRNWKENSILQIKAIYIWRWFYFFLFLRGYLVGGNLYVILALHRAGVPGLLTAFLLSQTDLDLPLKQWLWNVVCDYSVGHRSCPLWPGFIVSFDFM